MAHSMKRTTDRMARRLSADLAKAQLHRKLHHMQSQGGRKHQDTGSYSHLSAWYLYKIYFNYSISDSQMWSVIRLFLFSFVLNSVVYSSNMYSTFWKLLIFFMNGQHFFNRKCLHVLIWSQGLWRKFYPPILTVFLPKCIQNKCCEARCDSIVTTTVDIEYIVTSWSNKCKLYFHNAPCHWTPW